MGNTLKAVASLNTSLLRLGRGAVVKGHRSEPDKPLELYDSEHNPASRHVRETLTELDLDVLIFPVPQGGQRYRQKLIDLAGSDVIPFLVDPNTDERIQGPDAIASYLYAQYGPAGEKAPKSCSSLAGLASALRGSKGKNARPSKAPAQALELYSFEASPYARLVRETLCELEISYMLHNVGKGPGRLVDWLPPGMREKSVKDYQPVTENRRKLVKLGGHMMVPYLVDPNTGIAMYESADIQAYLKKTYGA